MLRLGPSYVRTFRTGSSGSPLSSARLERSPLGDVRGSRNVAANTPSIVEAWNLLALPVLPPAARGAGCQFSSLLFSPLSRRPRPSRIRPRGAHAIRSSSFLLSPLARATGPTDHAVDTDDRPTHRRPRPDDRRRSRSPPSPAFALRYARQLTPTLLRSARVPAICRSSINADVDLAIHATQAPTRQSRCGMSSAVSRERRRGVAPSAFPSPAKRDRSFPIVVSPSSARFIVEAAVVVRPREARSRSFLLPLPLRRRRLRARLDSGRGFDRM